MEQNFKWIKCHLQSALFLRAPSFARILCQTTHPPPTSNSTYQYLHTSVHPHLPNARHRRLLIYTYLSAFVHSQISGFVPCHITVNPRHYFPVNRYPHLQILHPHVSIFVRLDFLITMHPLTPIPLRFHPYAPSPPHHHVPPPPVFVYHHTSSYTSSPFHLHTPFETFMCCVN